MRNLKRMVLAAGLLLLPLSLAGGCTGASESARVEDLL